MGKAATSSSHLFIELQELRGDTWTETGRWNHALEEDALPLSPGHDASDPHTWSQPRLPTISVAAVVRLQLALSPANVFLGLRADSLREIAEAMLQRLVAGGLLAAEQHERVAEALLSAKRLAPGPDSPNRGPTVAPRRRPRRRMAGFEASDAEADELFHMLDPEKGEEAASLLLAHLGFLTEPMVAFARLATPVDLGCEGQAPVRYLCLLLGPEAEAEGTSRMAHAFGSILSDEHAVAALNRASSPQALLDALNAHFEGLSILPHVFSFSSAPRLNGMPASGDPSRSSAASTSESGDESVDEDEVLLAEVEERIRARKGMRTRPQSRPMSRSVSRERDLDRSEGESPVESARASRPGSSLGDKSGSQDGAVVTPKQRRRREEFQHRLDKLLELSTERLPVLPPPPGSALDASIGGRVVLDMASLRSVQKGRRRLFIEMEQAEAGVWRETDHWNWALAQEKATDGTWSRPHLPTISIASLMALYNGLGDHNVHLELPAVSLLEAVEVVGDKLVQSGELPAEALPQLIAALSSRDAVGGGDAADESALAPDANEEAALLLLSHVDFLDKPLMSFVRLKTCLDLGAEGKTPVRYLFFHFGPRGQAAASEKVGKALAGILLDEDFISASLAASSSRHFLRVLACQLDCMTVVPHSHMRGHETANGGGSGGDRATDDSSPGSGGPLRRAAQSFGRGLGRAEASAERRLEEGGGAMAAAARAQLDRLSQSRAGRATARRVSQVSYATAQRKRWAGRHLPLQKTASCFLRVVHFLQRYSIPLLLGIVVALPWATFAPDSYEYWVGADSHKEHFMPFGKSADLFEHPVTLHFLVNDVFMCFFFGLAMKEVTESVLPGGSLNPPKKAMSSLVGTIGGVAGPIGVYMGLVAVQWAAGSFEGYEMEPIDDASADGHRRMLASTNATLVPVTLSDLMYGWGVPTATDISIAWMVAMRVFPLRHPAIDYLLLLAVADDFIGLIIIALAYPDPLHPTQWSWATGLFGVFAVCLFLRVCMRKVACVQKWYVYVALGGVFSWIVLLNARLHPALALAFVVPFMPADGHHAALHAFEHAIKAPVDLGMFFFTLANAGIDLKGGVGGLTFSVLLALALGKVIGIAGFAYLAHRFGVARLPGSMRVTDLLMVGIIAAVGLTVALFISGEAFTDEALAGEAKMGSLLSICMGAIALALGQLPHFKTLAACPPPKKGVAFSDIDMLVEDQDQDDLLLAVTSSLQRSMLLRKAFLAGDRYFSDHPKLRKASSLEPVHEASDAEQRL